MGAVIGWVAPLLVLGTIGFAAAASPPLRGRISAVFPSELRISASPIVPDLSTTAPPFFYLPPSSGQSRSTTKGTPVNPR